MKEVEKKKLHIFISSIVTAQANLSSAIKWVIDFKNIHNIFLSHDLYYALLS